MTTTKNESLGLIFGVSLMAIGGLLHYRHRRQRSWATMFSFFLSGLGAGVLLAALLLFR
jgi:hypothetical protein